MSEPPPSLRPAAPQSKPTPPGLRPFYLLAGFLCVVLGLVGLAVPGLPTTIFLILAAGCFARSSPRLENWLLTHPKFGPPIVAWRETGAISRRIKIVAIGSMLASMAMVCLSPAPRWVDWLMAAIILASAAFVATRQESGRRARPD